MKQSSVKITHHEREIYGIWMKPDEEGTYPAMICSHGYNGSGDDYLSFGEYFTERNIIVFSFDFCGGSIRSCSDMKTDEMTIFTEKEDLLAVFDYVKSSSFVAADEIYLFGSSQGGLISALVANDIDTAVKGLFLQFPAFCIPDDWNGRFQEESDIPDSFNLWGMTLGKQFFTSLRGFSVYQNIGNFTGPVLALHGDADEVVALRYSEKLPEIYQNCRLEVFQNEGHGFSPEGEARMRSLIFGRIHNQQAYNPYLPSWEYIPDGEPYVFGDRVYVYGSHDYFGGYVFCMGDYVCWSAPLDDLGNWRYEGVIYGRNEDPCNKEGKMCLYAPDVTVGPDGRYYLFYVLDKVSRVSVAVCDEPAGKYVFYGYVHDKENRILGERTGDQPQFDPGVLTEGNRTYLYTGFCGQQDASRKGAMVTVLEADMLTIADEPKVIVPGAMYSAGTEFEKHAFFEASSIRKVGEQYYFIYSSEVMHELCYAVSESPTGEFHYGGVLVSNCDYHMDKDKPADMPMAYGGNNHGSIIKLPYAWYIFYHRQTNGTWFSRQGCAEKLTLRPDGVFEQAELTSCGLNDGPLAGKGTYPAYLACHLFTETPSVYVGGDSFPKIMQDGKDGDEETGFIANMKNSATAGFRYFSVRRIKEVAVTTRGYAKGVFEVRTTWNGAVLAEIPVESSNVWETKTVQMTLASGVYAFYFTFRGTGNISLRSFTLQ